MCEGIHVGFMLVLTLSKPLFLQSINQFICHNQTKPDASTQVQIMTT